MKTISGTYKRQLHKCLHDEKGLPLRWVSNEGICLEFHQVSKNVMTGTLHIRSSDLKSYRIRALVDSMIEELEFYFFKDLVLKNNICYNTIIKGSIDSKKDSNETMRISISFWNRINMNSLDTKMFILSKTSLPVSSFSWKDLRLDS